MSMGEAWWTQMFQNDVGAATRIVQSLQAIGIKIIAFDFDLTIVDLNTGGKWKKSVDQLASHMRPCMKDLIGAALINPNIVVSIVTFSIQPGLINEMLKTVYPNCNTNEIIIAANPNKIKPQLTPEIYNIGKQKHIEDVCKLLEARQGQKIVPEQIILFDDRKRYCKIAEENGHLAFTVCPDVSISQIKSYVDQQVNKRLHYTSTPMLAPVVAPAMAPVPAPKQYYYDNAAPTYVQSHQPASMVAVLPIWPERQDHSIASTIFEKSAAARHLDSFPSSSVDHVVAEKIFERSAVNRTMYDHPYNAPLPNLQQLMPGGYSTSQAVVLVNQTPN